MRTDLENLWDDIIIFRYSLPNPNIGIDKSLISKQQDYCFACSKEEKLGTLIYKGLLDYCFDEDDIKNCDDPQKLLQRIHLRIRLVLDSPNKKRLISQGFYGEVLLYCMLEKIFQKSRLICRGHLFNPLNQSETTGYDAFHFIETERGIELWFGEVKFYEKYDGALREVLSKISDKLSDEYLKLNLEALVEQYHQYLASSKTKDILQEWKSNGYEVQLQKLIEKYNIRLVYPVFIICENKTDYNTMIRKCIDLINNNVKSKKIIVPASREVFFILLPISSAKQIKLDTLKCIRQNT